MNKQRGQTNKQTNKQIDFANQGETISRKAANDALEKVAELYPWRVPGDRDSYSQYNEGWTDAIGRSEIALEELPSAKPEISLEQVLEYCRSRCITVVEDEVLYKRLDSAYTEGYTAAESKYRKIFDEFLGIVFCKDCKHWRHDDHICQYYGGASPRVAIDFCSKGERRTDEGD